MGLFDWVFGKVVQWVCGEARLRVEEFDVMEGPERSSDKPNEIPLDENDISVF